MEIFIPKKKPTKIGAQSLQSIQGFLTLIKTLRTNLYNIKVEEKSISYEDSSVAPEKINIVRNPLFETVEQQSLQQEKPTFVAQ
jgi:hypothetical protein